MTNLKSCPFCGWGTIIDSGFLNYRCTCNSCGASTKSYPTWELAVEAWNRRVEPERQKGKWINDGDCYICSKCQSAYNWWTDSQVSNYCPNCGKDMT